MVTQDELRDPVSINILIPVFNESSTVCELIDRVAATVRSQGWDGEIVETFASGA